jgi:hypothetical protein
VDEKGVHGCETGQMHAAFGTVVVIVCVVAAVVALLTLLGSGRTWSEFGRSGMVMDRDRSSAATRPAAPVSGAEREAEIRAMLEALAARRARRGEPALDVEAEMARLSAPAPPPANPELVEEVRVLVEMRNRRRLRAGEAPLDVEAEVQRELRNLGGG